MELKETQMQLTLVLLIVLARMGTAASFDQALPGCPEFCGNVSIPYPFGIGSVNGHNCFLEEALDLTCNNSILYRRNRNVSILNISLDGKLEYLWNISKVCKNGSDNGTSFGHAFRLSTPAFAISSEDNKFITVGCDSYGYLNTYRDGNESSSIGCLTRCNSKEYVKSMQRDGDCAGIGCCQVDIPPGMKNITIRAYSFNNFNYFYGFNCWNFRDPYKIPITTRNTLR